MPHDLISLGECLVEFTRSADGAYNAGFAGDAFNVLFYAGRLGLRTGFISAVGDDLFTPMIVEGIEREGIDSSHLLRLSGRENGLYFIELDDAGEYRFHFWRRDSAATQTLLEHDLDRLARFIAGSEFFLITGVTMAVMEGPERLTELLERVHGSTRIVFDTNYRARLWSSPAAYRERFEKLLPMIDILLPTASDLAAIYDDESLERLCERFEEMGPAMIAIKGGSEGSALWRDHRLHWQPPREVVTVVDATGAGDAFNAGFLTGLARAMSIEESCELGQRTARHVLGVPGAIDHAFRPTVQTTIHR